MGGLKSWIPQLFQSISNQDAKFLTKDINLALTKCWKGLKNIVVQTEKTQKWSWHSFWWCSWWWQHSRSGAREDAAKYLKKGTKAGVVAHVLWEVEAECLPECEASWNSLGETLYRKLVSLFCHRLAYTFLWRGGRLVSPQTPHPSYGFSVHSFSVRVDIWRTEDSSQKC